MLLVNSYLHYTFFHFALYYTMYNILVQDTMYLKKILHDQEKHAKLRKQLKVLFEKVHIWLIIYYSYIWLYASPSGSHTIWSCKYLGTLKKNVKVKFFGGSSFHYILYYWSLGLIHSIFLKIKGPNRLNSHQLKLDILAIFFVIC